VSVRVVEVPRPTLHGREGNNDRMLGPLSSVRTMCSVRNNGDSNLLHIPLVIVRLNSFESDRRVQGLILGVDTII
jgi:hypothetical protein